ncbi:hypothetical protein [Streptococcus sp. 27098_8_76]
MMSGINVFVLAGGAGLTNPYANTIEKKVSKSSIISALEDENVDNKDDIMEIQEDKNKLYSVWGYSERDNNLKSNSPKSGDIIFITNKNAAIYLATVFKVIEAKNLDFIWAGRQTWRYKIILKDVLRIFIPYSVDGDITQWCQEHPLSPGLSSIRHLLNIYDNMDSQLDFRYIIGKQLRKGPFQGSLKVTIDNAARYPDVGEIDMSDVEVVLSRLELYCQTVHFECIVKEI